MSKELIYNLYISPTFLVIKGLQSGQNDTPPPLGRFYDFYPKAPKKTKFLAIKTKTTWKNKKYQFTNIFEVLLILNIFLLIKL